MITRDEYLYLCEKYFSGKCTADEERELIRYRDEIELKEYPWNAPEMGGKDEIREVIYGRLKARIRKRTVSMNLVSVAAVILVILSFGLYFFTPDTFIPGMQPRKQAGNESVQFEKTDVSPGGNKAILTLANGSAIALDDVKNGELANLGGTAVKKTGEGQITYVSQGSPDREAIHPFNTLTTPKGGQYTIVLSDGTKVWLNAASSLRFPVTFTGSERNVFLSGEAYFEVAKNEKVPFNVRVNDMKVIVLGTHFNIMAYPEENEVKTTLFEGAVNLINGRSSNLLKPGQEGNLLKDGTVQVKKANIEEAIAWKEGKFIFNKIDIQSIMRQLSRWYDVEVVYQGEIPRDLFIGKINRDSKLSQVLHILELSHVHFKIEEKKIIIMP